MASILQPFRGTLWLLLLATVHIIALLIWLVDRLSPVYKSVRRLWCQVSYVRFIVAQFCVQVSEEVVVLGFLYIYSKFGYRHCEVTMLGCHSEMNLCGMWVRTKVYTIYLFSYCGGGLALVT